MNEVAQLISTIGFPIFCVIALGWFIYLAFQKFTQSSEKREEKLYTIIGEAQKTNETLLETNGEFVRVLETYKDDLVCIKEDVSAIKEKIDGRE